MLTILADISASNFLIAVLYFLAAFVIFWGGTKISAAVPQPAKTPVYVLTILLVVAVSLNGIFLAAGHPFIRW